MGLRDQFIAEGMNGRDNPDALWSEADHNVSDVTKIFWQLADICLGNYDIKARQSRKNANTGEIEVDHSIRRYNAFKTTDIYDEYLETCNEFLAVFEKHFKKRKNKNKENKR